MHRFHRWREALQAAYTEAEVGRIMRDYVASIDPVVLKALPEECQAALRDPEIQAAAMTIMHAELRQSGDPDEADALLHEIAHTFAAASIRISKLRREPIGPS